MATKGKEKLDIYYDTSAPSNIIVRRWRKEKQSLLNIAANY